METLKGLKHYIITGVLSFIGVCTMPYMMQLNGKRLEFTNSIWSVISFFALHCLLSKVLRTRYNGKKKEWLWPAVVGFVFSFAMVIGTQLELRESVPVTDIYMWIAFLVWGILATILLRYSWEYLLQVKSRKDQEGNLQEGTFEWKSFLIRAGIIFACYFIVFLAVYPGFFVYDAQDEVTEVITRKFSTHHPMVHVLLLGGFTQLGYKLTNSYNIGIAMYTLFQMTFMSCVFSWCVELLKKRGLNKVGRTILTLFFGLFPVVVMSSLCSTKDGIFGGLVLMTLLYLQEMSRDFDAFWKSKKKVCMLFFSTLGMTMFRHNGYYAFVVFGLLLLFYYRKQWKKILLYVLLVMITYSGINSGLKWVLNADDSENQEVITVPISQLTRTFVYKEAELPKEEIDTLLKFLPEDVMRKYRPKVSDGVKIAFNNANYEKYSGEFWKLWATWGLRYPITYVNGWLMTSYGFWYPDTVIDVYRGNTVFTYTYEDSSYFGYETELPGVRDSKIPWLDELYRKMSLEIAQHKIPVVSMLFSPGFMFWVAAFFLGLLAYAKQWDSIIPFLFPGLCWLTLILGPTFLPRYVFFLWSVVPVLLCEFVRVRYNIANKKDSV